MRNTNAWDGQKERSAIGLQFFAEDGMDWDDADMDDDGGDDLFEDCWEDDAALEDQQDGDPAAEEGGEAEGLGNQQTGQPADPAAEAGTGAAAPAAEQGQAAQQPQAEAMTDIRYNGQILRVPQAAMQAISGALGQDAAMLIQKGMNYERRGARETMLLQRLAEASGKDLSTFMREAEGQIEQMQLERARQEVAATLPENTPAEAIDRLARQRLSEQRAAREVEAFRQRQQRTAAEAQKREAEKQRLMAPWSAYFRAFPVKSLDEIPEPVQRMANEGMDPLAAHYKWLYEQEKTKTVAAQKNAQNRQTAVGSMQSSGMDEDDPFLRGLLGD